MFLLVVAPVQVPCHPQTKSTTGASSMGVMDAKPSNSLQMLNSLFSYPGRGIREKQHWLTICRNTSGRNAFDDDNFTHHPSHLAL